MAVTIRIELATGKVVEVDPLEAQELLAALRGVFVGAPVVRQPVPAEPYPWVSPAYPWVSPVYPPTNPWPNTLISGDPPSWDGLVEHPLDIAIRKERDGNPPGGCRDDRD